MWRYRDEDSKPWLEISPKAHENWVRLCSAFWKEQCLPFTNDLWGKVSLHTPEKLDSVSSSPSGSSHLYLLSAKEEESRDYFGVSVLPLSCCTTLLITWVSQREEEHVCTVVVQGLTEVPPVIVAWIAHEFLLAKTLHQPRDQKPVLLHSLAEDKGTERRLCSCSWALTAHFSSKTPALALCFYSSSPGTPVRRPDFYSHLMLRWSKLIPKPL